MRKLSIVGPRGRGSSLLSFDGHRCTAGGTPTSFTTDWSLRLHQHNRSSYGGHEELTHPVSFYRLKSAFPLFFFSSSGDKPPTTSQMGRLCSINEPHPPKNVFVDAGDSSNFTRARLVLYCCVSSLALSLLSLTGGKKEGITFAPEASLPRYFRAASH